MCLFHIDWAEKLWAYCHTNLSYKSDDYWQDEETVLLGFHVSGTTTLQPVSDILHYMELGLQFADGTRLYTK